jgi:signal transduction histidine kinase
MMVDSASSEQTRAGAGGLPAGASGVAAERPFGRRLLEPPLLDALLAVAFAAAGVAQALTLNAQAGERASDWFGITLVFLTALPLVFLRLAPIEVLATVLIAYGVRALMDYPMVTVAAYPSLIAVFTVGVLGTYRTRVIAGFLVAAGLLTLYFSHTRGMTLGALVGTWFTFAMLWSIGTAVGLYRQSAQEARAKAALLSADREALAREAVANERARLARELHDVVGHTLNVIVLQAGGAQRVFDKKPDLARETLGGIEEAARQALKDVERMLGILRTTDDEQESPDARPGLGQLAGLAEQVSDAGLPVEVHREGDVRDLPQSVDLSAYRIIQEALTNSLKHAGPARATVTLRYGERALEVEVLDDGCGAAAPTTGGGRGLVGMRERVALFGGSFEVGPRPQCGYRVYAQLPLGGDQE